MTLELPPPPPPRSEAPGGGPRGLPDVTWGLWQALAVFLLGNLVIAQFVVGTVVLVAMGVDVGEPIEGLPQIAASVAADAAFLAVMLVWFRWRARDWPRRIGITFGREGLRDALIGAVSGLVLYGVIAFVIGVPLLALFRLVFGESVVPPEQIPGHLSTNAKALTVFLALVLAPIAEELYFRGILYRGVRDRHGVALGMIVSSVLFGATHLVQAPWRDALFLQTLMVFTGLGLAAIYERRGNLVADIAAHTAFNVIGIVFIFAGR